MGQAQKVQMPAGLLLSLSLSWCRIAIGGQEGNLGLFHPCIPPRSSSARFFPRARGATIPYREMVR